MYKCSVKLLLVAQNLTIKADLHSISVKNSVECILWKLITFLYGLQKCKKCLAQDKCIGMVENLVFLSVAECFQVCLP